MELTVYDEQQNELLCTEIQNIWDAGEPDEETKARIEEFKAGEMAAKAARIRYEELGQAMFEEKARSISDQLKAVPPPPAGVRARCDGEWRKPVLITFPEDADIDDIARDVNSESGSFDDVCNIPELRIMSITVPVI